MIKLLNWPKNHRTLTTLFSLIPWFCNCTSGKSIIFWKFRIFRLADGLCFSAITYDLQRKAGFTRVKGEQYRTTHSMISQLHFKSSINHFNKVRGNVWKVLGFSITIKNLVLLARDYRLFSRKNIQCRPLTIVDRKRLPYKSKNKVKSKFRESNIFLILDKLNNIVERLY